MRSRLMFVGSVLTGMVVAGCSPTAPLRLPVSGQVTFKGEPLADGSVTFEPVDPTLGSMSGAVVKNGKYLIPAETGLLPGRYTVRFSSPLPGTRSDDLPGSVKLAKERLPAKYNTSSTLSADVTAAGPNTHDFNLD